MSATAGGRKSRLMAQLHGASRPHTAFKRRSLYTVEGTLFSVTPATLLVPSARLSHHGDDLSTTRSNARPESLPERRVAARVLALCALAWLALVAARTATAQRAARGDTPPVFFQEATWAPDARSLLLSVYRGQSSDIYRLELDGGRPVRLTQGEGSHSWTTWAPDGQRFAFRSQRDETGEIRVLNADGSNGAALTNDAWDDSAPHWSPDGKTIVYTSKRDGTWTLHQMDASGAAARRIGDPNVDEWNPAFSPDGTRVVFYATEDEGNHVYIMDADGSNRRRLTPGAFPSWSPDGRWIAYDHAGDIYLIRPEGGNPRHHVTDGFCPRWSPDGSKIVFIRGEWPQSEVFMVEADGSDFQRLTGPRAFE